MDVHASNRRAGSFVGSVLATTLALTALVLGAAPAATADVSSARGTGPADSLPSGTYDASLSALSSAFAGTQVQLFCGGDDNVLFLGLTLIEDAEIWLNEPAVCVPSRRFLNGWRPRLDGRPDGRSRLARALLAFTHESVHATGDASEAHTECTAIQRVPELIELAGERRPLYTAGLTRLAVAIHRQYRGVFGLNGQSYWDGARCRSDGRWDLTPGDGVWP